jgi:molybdate/tungstate transport system substrate-binding protein
MTRRSLTILLVGSSVLAIGGCGSTASDPRAHSGSVSVIYAGSLSQLMEGTLGPRFHRTDGYSFEGFGAGSSEAAKQIKGGVRQADVFVSASAEADRELEGQANGKWASWYATFAATPLVLGYDPNSEAGRQLAQGKPWYLVISEPGVRVGRTDPKLDPKGALTVEAVEHAAQTLRDPGLARSLRSFAVFPETDLVGRLQSGQLDAGFFYAIEARAAHIPTVSLAPVSKTASYTVTILSRAANRPGAEAFVRYLLRAMRSSAIAGDGLSFTSPPRLTGPPAAVPTALRSAFAAGSR